MAAPMEVADTVLRPSLTKMPKIQITLSYINVRIVKNKLHLSLNLTERNLSRNKTKWGFQ